MNGCCCGYTWKLINCHFESSLEKDLPYWTIMWTAGNICYIYFQVWYFMFSYSQISSYFCIFELQAGECSTGHFFRGNSVLWTGRECYYQIQVMMIVIYLTNFKYTRYKKYRRDSIDFQIDDAGEVEELGYKLFQVGAPWVTLMVWWQFSW